MIDGTDLDDVDANDAFLWLGRRDMLEDERQIIRTILWKRIDAEDTLDGERSEKLEKTRRLPHQHSKSADTTYPYKPSVHHACSFYSQ